MRHATSHAAILCRSAVQKPNSRTGVGSRSGGTAAKWPALPTSIPAACGLTILSPGSAAATRRASSLRCLRVIRPLFNRSKVDILRFLMPYSLSLNFRFRLRLGSACENHADSPSGQSRAFMQGRPSANQYLAGSRSHAARRAQRHQTRCDHSLPPESVSIETQFGKPQSGSRRVSRSIHRPRRRHALQKPLARR